MHFVLPVEKGVEEVRVGWERGREGKAKPRNSKFPSYLVQFGVSLEAMRYRYPRNQAGRDETDTKHPRGERDHEAGAADISPVIGPSASTWEISPRLWKSTLS